MAARKRGSTIQCIDQVVAGTKPRLTLCSPCVPGSKRADAALDAVLDALVIASLEMQAVMLLAGAPVTAVERLAGSQKNTAAADGFGAAHRARLTMNCSPRRLRHRAEATARVR